MRTFLAVLIFLSLMGCYTVLVPEDPEWKLWPRRGSTPLASAGCMTDSCLEWREAVLIENLGPNENQE